MKGMKLPSLSQPEQDQEGLPQTGEVAWFLSLSLVLLGLDSKEAKEVWRSPWAREKLVSRTWRCVGG